MKPTSHRKLKAIILLAGSFTFAFLFGEMIHEFGHFLGHKIFNSPNVGIYLDPFGSSHITGARGLSNYVIAITSATGPLSNLFFGIATFFVLWKFRRPILLPFLIWGPVACIQEGVTFSLGLLTPGGDARWVSTLGISPIIILIFGILLLIMGIFGIALLLSQSGLRTSDPLWQKFLVILTGMGSLMIIRAIYSSFVSPAAKLENLIPLVFSFILAIVITILHRPLSNWITASNLSIESSMFRFAPLFSILLGTLIFVFQIITFNKA